MLKSDAASSTAPHRFSPERKSPLSCLPFFLATRPGPCTNTDRKGHKRSRKTTRGLEAPCLPLFSTTRPGPRLGTHAAKKQQKTWLQTHMAGELRRSALLPRSGHQRGVKLRRLASNWPPCSPVPTYHTPCCESIHL
ncbi:hypothetical protein NDU88_010204 [Pleurodeles waltl]|uniref:Uncharacterized protein n=1 Tax=Pleurodeles waltl TaxID=8319 RepID=A0AAV7QWP7_PLEWA|nr:hypothetical protein NDU88_010204 [Pleurodeles waltl]